MATKKDSPKPKSKKNAAPKPGRRWFRQLLFRLFLLSIVSGVILGIGYYKYGWQPFGSKVPREHVKHKVPDFPSLEQPKQVISDKLQQVVDKLKSEPKETPAPDAFIPTPVPQKTPAPTPTPKPQEPKVKSDEKKLKDFLDSQFSSGKKKGK